MPKLAPENNNLSTCYPDLAAEWHPTKNSDLFPQDVTIKSGKKVWWVCKHGHEWQATVYNRTGVKSGCPFCSGRRAIPGVNDLSTVNPELAAQWHPTKNGDLTPQDVTPGARKKVWWLGGCGHEWQTCVNSRNHGHGCPICSGMKTLAGFNDLATIKPELAAQWHPTKNGDLTPQDVTPGSQRKAWWLGDCGHEWQAEISSRVYGAGCPFCAGVKTLAGFNDLATLNPELAAEWHPTKNEDLIPQDVTVGSQKKVWWLCSCGHEWETKVIFRSRGRGCPRCAKKGKAKTGNARIQYKKSE